MEITRERTKGVGFIYRLKKRVNIRRLHSSRRKSRGAIPRGIEILSLLSNSGLHRMKTFTLKICYVESSKTVDVHTRLHPVKVIVPYF